MTVRILAGNIVQTDFVAVPEAPATVSLADVTVRITPPHGYDPGVDEDGIIDLTEDIVEDPDGTFYADYLVPDDAPDGLWHVRWESNPPSAKIARDDRFRSVASYTPNP